MINAIDKYLTEKYNICYKGKKKNRYHVDYIVNEIKEGRLMKVLNEYKLEGMREVAYLYTSKQEKISNYGEKYLVIGLVGMLTEKLIESQGYKMWQGTQEIVMKGRCDEMIIYSFEGCKLAIQHGNDKYGCIEENHHIKMEMIAQSLSNWSISRKKRNKEAHTKNGNIYCEDALLLALFIVIGQTIVICVLSTINVNLRFRNWSLSRKLRNKIKHSENGNISSEEKTLLVLAIIIVTLNILVIFTLCIKLNYALMKNVTYVLMVAVFLSEVRVTGYSNIETTQLGFQVGALSAIMFTVLVIINRICYTLNV